jgi:hypothetical protein
MYDLNLESFIGADDDQPLATNTQSLEMSKKFGAACFISIWTQIIFLSILEKGILIGLYKSKSLNDVIMSFKFIVMFAPFIVVIVVFFIASLFYQTILPSYIFLIFFTMVGLGFSYIAILALYT